MTRTPRDLETREQDKRDTRDTWRPASILPTPDSQDGITYRWIRTSMLGQQDIKNVSTRFREGWEPVEAKDHPELQIMTDIDSRFEGGIEIGGLILCKTATENVDKRNAFYRDRAEAQQISVDQQYLRENDPRMPMSKPQRSTRITFGKGSGK